MKSETSSDSIDAARYMALDHVPVTPEAQSLSSALAARVYDAGTRRRKKRRGKHQTAFEQNAGALAADLLLAGKAPGRYSYRSTHKPSFKGERVGFTTFMQLIEGAVSAGLIELHETKGHYGRFDWGAGMESGRGKARRLRGTARFFELALAHGITPSNVEDHFTPSPRRSSCSSSRPPRSASVAAREAAAGWPSRRPTPPDGCAKVSRN